jgi:putative FmdB family regulatory protein
MPLYEYECEACSRRFELIQKFSDPPADHCKHCGKGPVRKLMSSPAIQFKGSGFYINDYAQKGKSDSATVPSNKTGDSAKSDAGTSTADTSTSTAKSDTPASTPSASAPTGPTKPAKGE